MLDLRWIIENETLIRKKLAARNNFPTDALERILASDGRRRELIQKVEGARARKNAISKEIPQIKKSGGDIAPLMAESTKIGDEMAGMEKELVDLQSSMEMDLLQIPNAFDDSVPIGSDEKGNREVLRWGEPRAFSFTALDHHDLGVNLGILDFDRATRLATTRFTTMLGQAARLNRAISQFMLDLHTREHGYLEVEPPFMVNSASLTGTGNLPKFEADLFKIAGDWDLYLVPTAEVPLTYLHRGEILDGRQLPIRYTAYTPCFRSEAGSYGADVRGLIRQHQFDKVELMAFTTAEDSYNEHERLTGCAEEVLKRLGLPFRTMLL